MDENTIIYFKNNLRYRFFVPNNKDHKKIMKNHDANYDSTKHLINKPN